MGRRRGQRGLNLIEVIISMGLMLMLMLAFYAVAEMLQRSQIVTDARLDARQRLRSATRTFALASSQSCAFFTATNATPKNIGGFSCRLPYVDGAGVMQPGDTAALAIPVDVTRPVDSNQDPKLPTTALMGAGGTPDGFCDGKYDIVVMTTRPMTPPSSRNPNAREVVLMRWTDQAATAWLAPLSINLTTLGPPKTMRTFDTYLEPLASDGFRVTYLTKGSRASACLLHAQYNYFGTQGAPQKEKFDFLFTARNIF